MNVFRANSFLILCITVLWVFGSCATEVVPEYDGYVLDWYDNFSGREINRDIWRHAIGGGNWGNHEMQNYTTRPENSRVENGHLIIEAHHEWHGGWPYTSARMTTMGRREMLYGRIEVRAKLPEGIGSWPAIWMMPADRSGYGIGWPDSGEIDIMEHVGHDPGRVHFSIHTSLYNHPAGTHKTGDVLLPDVSERFYTYGIEWTPDMIRWYIDDDDNTVFEYQNDHTDYRTWPFDKPFYLILNVAVGGDWAGSQGIDRESMPWQMKVDWVRVYRPADE